MIIEELHGDESVPAEYAMSPSEYREYVEEYNDWLDWLADQRQCELINRLISEVTQQ